MDLFWRRNRLGLLAASAIALLAAAPEPSQAQLFGGTCTTIDGPCSSFIEQQISYALQGIQELHEAETALQEDINTLKLPGQLFKDASADISQILGIAKDADLLIGNTGQFITNLGGSSYPIGPLNNPMAEIVKEQNAISNAIKQLGSVLDVENPNIANKATILAALTGENMTDDGRLKALQDANQVAATTGQQLQSLETILLAMAQGQHATMLSQADRQALEDKALDVMSQYTADQPTGPGF